MTYAAPTTTAPAQNWDLWIREMYVDPMELIIENDADASLSRVTYTVDADGTVTFADPQPVKVQYVAARAAASRPTEAWATHAEARPGQRPTSPPAAPAASDPAAPTGASQEGAGMDPAKLREALGLPADASDIEVSAAIAAAGLADQPPVEPAATAAEAETPPADVAATSGGPDLLAEITRLSTELAQVRAAENVRAEADRKKARDAFLDNAVRAGRLSPNERADFVPLYDQAPEATQKAVLARAVNTYPVAELGHDNGETPNTDPAASDDYWFSGYAMTTTGQEG
jgi:hypothetical protein